MRALVLSSLLVLTLAACGQQPAETSAEAGAEKAGEKASSLNFGADGMPSFRPGLWQVTHREGGEVETYQECRAAADAEDGKALLEETPGCTKTVSRDGGALKVEAQCEQVGVRSDTSLTIKGSDTHSVMALRMTVKNLRSEEPASTVETVIESRHIGECPAGVAPGDRVGEE